MFMPLLPLNVYVWCIEHVVEIPMGYQKCIPTHILGKATSPNKYTNGIHKFLGCLYDSYIYTFLI